MLLGIESIIPCNYRILVGTRLFSLLLVLSACGPKTTGTLKIAVLPIIDTLPMYVAQQQGLFAKHGVNVEFVPVASAPERDQLIAAAGADGTINETLAVSPGHFSTHCFK